jgi:Ca-activated chloride channel family protein
MTDAIALMTEDEVRRVKPSDEEAGFGALSTEKGRLPLKAMDVRARIAGLAYELSVEQTFANNVEQPIEATYIFPLPDRAAVTGFRMVVNERVIEGEMKERGAARQEYDEAIQAGHRAAITEEERSGVFTMRAGNIMPGEVARVRLTLTGPLPYDEGEAIFRFPLVVAPRYIPGRAIEGESVGDGVVPDTDAVPDASRITPPVLLPGFPNPVKLSLTVEIDPLGISISDLRSSLHTVDESIRDNGLRAITARPDERLDRDFVVRYKLGADAVKSSLALCPDADGREGTFLLTVVPPASLPSSSKPRDIVFVIDRSGSMGGWKMLAARRAVARMLDTLRERDRFMVVAFDDQIEIPNHSGTALTAATDRARFRAIEFLGSLEARGGTELAQPLALAAQTLAGGYDDRDRILVLATDGQVGNEDQILRTLGPSVKSTRIFTLGIDRAVNEGFLKRLAAIGGGMSEIVESEDRLDEVMDKIHRRIGTPLVTEMSILPTGLEVDRESIVPSRIPDLFLGAPVLISGRYRGTAGGGLSLAGRDAIGSSFAMNIIGMSSQSAAIPTLWARGQVRELEDRFVLQKGDRAELEKRIVATSIRFKVLSRFTAFVAVDRSEQVNTAGRVHKIVQPVEMPQGWEMPGAAQKPQMAWTHAVTKAGLFAGGGLHQGHATRMRAMHIEAKAQMPAASPAPRTPAEGPEAASVSAAMFMELHDAGEDDREVSGGIDLSGYERRARMLLDRLRKDASAPRAALSVLAVDLATLIEDLESVGADPQRIAPMKLLLAEIKDGFADSAALQLLARAETVLVTFLGGGAASTPASGSRRGFWKT